MLLKIKKKKITKYCASFLVVGGLRMQQLVFHHRREQTQRAPDTEVRNFINMEDP